MHHYVRHHTRGFGAHLQGGIRQEPPCNLDGRASSAFRDKRRGRAIHRKTRPPKPPKKVPRHCPEKLQPKIKG
jgi:hypothetical protein